MGAHLNDWRRHADRIQSLAALEFNYDAAAYERTGEKLGWNIDQHRALLGREAPGAPGVIFSRAQEAIRNYEFPDPSLITAIFAPEEKLEGRNMLMEAKFLGFTFYFGVRVTAVIDQTAPNEAGHPVASWGYAYRTLKGHFELGEIRFVVCKDLVTGEVEFQIDAYSRPDRIPNPFYRLGFHFFGRPLQRRFARTSIARMQRFARRAQSSRPVLSEGGSQHQG